jgi:hypothetical protein
MAKLIKSIFGVVDGEIHPRQIEAGEDCPIGLEVYAQSLDALDGEGGALAPEPEPQLVSVLDPTVQTEPESEGESSGDTKASKKAPENK